MTAVENENKALVARIYAEMWNEGDVALAQDIFAHPEGVQRFLAEFLQAFPDLHHSVEEIIAEGDRVVAHFSARGTHTGQWKLFAPTGKPVQYNGVTIAQVEGGKIVRHHPWWDALELVRQISGENI